MADRLDFQQLSFGVRRMGWIRFWIQVVLGIVVVGVLLFNNVGGSLARNSERAVGLGPGLSLTTLAFLVLLYSLWQGWLIVRSGRAIDSGARPSRGEVARVWLYGKQVDVSVTALVTSRHEDGHVTVFVPTGPNPTSGFIYHVDESLVELHPEIGVESMMKTVVSCGAGTASLFKTDKPAG